MSRDRAIWATHSLRGRPLKPHSLPLGNRQDSVAAKAAQSAFDECVSGQRKGAGLSLALAWGQLWEVAYLVPGLRCDFRYWRLREIDDEVMAGAQLLTRR